ncbi:hypothetical protein LTR49_024857 [Elasticomyces elasticus]|nr:hypothetical protein LTR49_024857 [Elasticomyces elasticus]KAK5743354.1 hypothetical protein LTS12_023905 [Elasticomyces elasticus]
MNFSSVLKPRDPVLVMPMYHSKRHVDIGASVAGKAAIIALETEQITADIEAEGETGTRKWWNYKALFATRDMWYRLWLLFIVSVFSQFIGGSVISYYMLIILKNVGITSSHQQLLMNAINVVLSFVSGIIGSFFVGGWGWRKLFLTGVMLIGLVYIPITVIRL